MYVCACVCGINSCSARVFDNYMMSFLHRSSYRENDTWSCTSFGVGTSLQCSHHPFSVEKGGAGKSISFKGEI